jgi:GDP-mannose pyrophosphatase NudK
MKSGKILSSKVLGKGWGTLIEYVFQYEKLHGGLAEITREVYQRGDSASILLHNHKANTVVLVRQFRPPALLNGHNPYLLEVCAGMLDGDNPESCVRREAKEEAGVEVTEITRLAAAYAHPASLSEVQTMFIGSFDEDNRTLGGGLPDEGEDIEVIELEFEQAFAMISTGEIRDMKTIILLQALMIDKLRHAVVVNSPRLNEQV